MDLRAVFEKWSSLLAPLGVPPGSEPAHRLETFLSDLRKRNESVNLISFSSPEELLLNHGVDSLMALAVPGISNSFQARCVDVGSGGGFPGFPLALVRPGWTMTFVESTGKKADSLRDTASRFSLKDAVVAEGRAETLAHEPGLRETYDLAFCRAVGSLPEVLELTLPFVKVGGACLLHRGADGPEEAKAAAKALQTLGGEVTAAHPYRLPGLDRTRHILRVEKTAPTPAAYPRRVGVPAKRPL